MRPCRFPLKSVEHVLKVGGEAVDGVDNIGGPVGDTVIGLRAIIV
jgi:hypothetical protein